MKRSNRRLIARQTAVVVISVSTGVLLARLAAFKNTVPTPPPAVATPTAIATTASSANPPVPVRFAPGVDSAILNAKTRPLPPSTNGKPSPDWKIAYVLSSVDDKKSEIWTANADGTNQQRVLGDADTPCWSPSRSLLAFARGGNVWVATADGKRQWQITFWPPNQRNEDGYPLHLYGLSWNLRERVVSFGRREQFTLTLPGGKTETLKGITLFHTSLLSGQTSTRYPFVESPTATPTDWNDEGIDGKYEHTSDLPGYDVTECSTRFGFTDNAYPSWSSTGNHFAFVRNGDLWVAQNEGTSPQESHATWTVDRLIPCAFYDDGVGYGDHNIDAVTAISWSPDEQYLAYYLETISRGNKREVHVAHLTKSDNDDDIAFNLPKVHDDIIDGDSAPCFSPDGKWILTTEREHTVAAAHGTIRTIPQRTVAVSRDGMTVRAIPTHGGESAVW